MTIQEVSLRAFGGVSNLTIEFQPGLNIVTGDNESGKSTLFRAIQHILLTATNLDKRTLRRDLDPFFPKPDGNFAECAIRVEAGGTYEVRRRWGTDAEEEATLPDGTVVRGAEAVVGAVSRILPVKPATFRTVFLADQSQLDQTAELLKQTPDARDEAAASLRSVSLAAGGVSPDLFRRVLEERIKELLGRWDTTRNQPEGGRRYTDPWTRGAGRVLKAFYAVEELEADLAAVVRSEEELDAARLRLEKSGDDHRLLSEFVQSHSGLYAALNAARGISGEIAANEERLKSLREDNRQWPLLQRDLGDGETEISALTARKESLDLELAAARGSQERAAIQEKLRRIDRLMLDLTKASSALKAIDPVDEEALADLREVESQLPHAQARLSTGHLRATVTSRAPGSIDVASDGGPPARHELPGDGSIDLSASRHLQIETAGVTIEVESGEERFEDLSAALDQLVEKRDRLRQVLGAQSVAEAETRQHAHRSAQDRMARTEQEILAELGVADLQAAMAAREELSSAASGGENTLQEPAGAPLARSQESITDEISTASRELGVTSGKLQRTRDELKKLSEEHGSQEHLENQLGETNRLLAELRARRDQYETPEGFASTEEFLLAYESRQSEREVAASAHNACRVAYAELIGSQSDRTSEEICEELGEARLEFDRVRREAESLQRVGVQAEKVLGELDRSVFDPFVAKVAAYAGMVTEGDYKPEAGTDPLGPERFLRTGAADGLSYELLSQGTRDSLALAVRLAIADTVIGSGSAPFVLDDPLVDMDPGRRAAAASALRMFGERHQVILLTCHPEHARLFEGANQITIPAG